MMAKQAVPPIARKNRQVAIKSLIIQLALGLILCALFGLGMALPGAKSAFIGMWVAWLPSLLFVLLAFRVANGSYAANVIRNFFVAEIMKWFALVILFSAAFMHFSGPWLPFFVTIMVLLHVQWAAWFFLNSKTS